MKEKGSITILSLIVFSFILIVILFIVNISNTENVYNYNTSESLQHKFILESHFNYMINEENYINEIEKILKYSIEKGKTNNMSFKIDEKILDSRASIVKVLYDGNDGNLANVLVTNHYHGMDKLLELKLRIVNELFLNNDGHIVYEELNSSEQIKILELFNMIENSDISERKNIIISKDDIVIDRDLDFNGIIISTQGRLIIEDGVELNLRGLLISRKNPLGNINIIKDENAIRKAGVHLPDFFKFEVIYKTFK